MDFEERQWFMDCANYYMEEVKRLRAEIAEPKALKPKVPKKSKASLKLILGGKRRSTVDDFM